jgi:hypothetical protein
MVVKLRGEVRWLNTAGGGRKARRTPLRFYRLTDARTSYMHMYNVELS